MKTCKWVFLPLAAIALLASCQNPNTSNPAGNTSGGDTSTSADTSTSSQITYKDAEEVLINTDGLPAEFFVNDEVQFTATVLPADAKQEVKWSVSNSTIAEISETGLFKCKGVGLTKVRATAENGIKANFDVVIREFVPVDSITVGKAQATVAANGGFLYMDTAVAPEEATNKKVVYTSDNESVATVDENGMVTAKAAGEANITATSKSDATKKATTKVTVTNQSWDNKAVVDLNANGKVDFQDAQNGAGVDAIPVGKSENIEILVVPYEFADYPFDQKTLDNIDALFNGDGEKDTGYWESVSSYYKKASYGKVNMHITIGEKYVTTDRAADLNNANSNYSAQAMRKAYNKYKSDHNTNGVEFDSDHNGYVDAIYIIYSAPDYSKVSSLNNSLFWAYVSWSTGDSADVNNPKPLTYMWASYDFMYGSGDTKVDAHTFIHETGHLMGANDYYNYNKGSSRKPLGGIDMMDENIGSHNAWTKMAYGWIDPIYVNGNAKVTLKSAQLQGDAVVIKDNWNGTAFDEMIVLELSTNDGLNALDSSRPYQSRPAVYSEPGIKMYHVDNRLGRKKNDGTIEYFKGTPTKATIGNYHQVACNTDDPERQRNETPELFYEIALIQSGKKATMLKNGANGTNADLFHTGDYFRFSDYSEFFYYEDKFNDGSKFNYEIYFEKVTKEEATRVIQKVA